MLLYVRPSDLRYTKNVISPKFDDGHTMSETVQDILEGRIFLKDLHPLLVMEYHNILYVVHGNRRLYLFRRLEDCGFAKTVNIDKVAFDETIFHEVFTTKNKGASITVAGEKSEAIMDKVDSLVYLYTYNEARRKFIPEWSVPRAPPSEPEPVRKKVPYYLDSRSRSAEPIRINKAWWIEPEPEPVRVKPLRVPLPYVYVPPPRPMPPPERVHYEFPCLKPPYHRPAPPPPPPPPPEPVVVRSEPILPPPPEPEPVEPEPVEPEPIVEPEPPIEPEPLEIEPIKRHEEECECPPESQSPSLIPELAPPEKTPAPPEPTPAPPEPTAAPPEPTAAPPEAEPAEESGWSWTWPWWILLVIAGSYLTYRKLTQE